MNTTRSISRIAAYSLAAALAGMAPALRAEQAKPPCPDGPGWMAGYGMGHGMMGGYGMGPGMMMGSYWGSGLDLTSEQQTRVNKIQDDTRKLHWNLMNEMMNQQARLRDLYLAPKRNDGAIDTA